MTQNFYFQGPKSFIQKKHLHSCVRSFLCCYIAKTLNYPNIQAQWLDKKTMAHVQNGILFNLRKDEVMKIDAMWKSLDE